MDLQIENRENSNEYILDGYQMQDWFREKPVVLSFHRIFDFFIIFCGEDTYN